jgi:Tol biopolymer transport system component
MKPILDPVRFLSLELLTFIIMPLLVLGVHPASTFGNQAQSQENDLNYARIPLPKSALDLKTIPYKIVYETYRQTEGRDNWELYTMNADGSDPNNLTKTPNLDEMYPHVSPDGTKICYIAEEGTNRRNKVRSVYYMNVDGTNRVKVADNAREPCWGPDSKTIAYLKGEFQRYNISEYATSGLYFYDLSTKAVRQHPNKALEHLYAICWSPDGKWFLGVVKGASEYSDAILAIDANSTKVYNLAKWGVKGCRPDFSRDGKMMTWGDTDWDLCFGQINFSSDEPTVSNIRKFAGCNRDSKVYHVDFSPDGKYIAFTYGPSTGSQTIGGFAQGWNICITDISGKWVQVTMDGNHNKEPDWIVPVGFGTKEPPAK